MVCYNPLLAVPIGTSSNGKVNYSIIGKLVDYKVKPEGAICFECGSCIGCKLKRSRDWAIRGFHESLYHNHSCFITLTYSPEYLPSDGSLKSEHLRDFWKRLRRRIEPILIRYIACGEYGEKYFRPHYHACIFGYDFPDKKLLYSDNGYNIYTSDFLSSVWKYGLCTVGSVTYDSIGYVARYVTKKITGPSADEHYKGKTPEFLRVSNKPGLGYQYLMEKGEWIYSNDFVQFKEHFVTPPRYYDKKFGEQYPEWIEWIKEQRIKKAGKIDQKELEYYRLSVKEELQWLRLSNGLPRKLEQDL